MITVSSCGVKHQEVLSGLEKERLKHWRYTCTFVAFLNITILYFFFSFHLGCNIFFKQTKYLAENVTDMYRKVMVGDVARKYKYKRKKIKI